MKHHYRFSSFVVLIAFSVSFCAETNKETQLIDSLIKVTASSKIESTKPNQATSILKDISPMKLRDSTDQTMIFVTPSPIIKPFTEIRIEYNEISGGEKNNWVFNFFIAKIESAMPDLLEHISNQYAGLLKKKGVKHIVDNETNISWNLKGNFSLVVSLSKKEPQRVTIQISKKDSED